MVVAKDAMIKATCSINAPLEYYGCTNSNIYHVIRFHMYRKCFNNTEPDVAECVNHPFK